MSDKSKFKTYYAELSNGIAWSIIASFAAIIMSIIALAKCAPSSTLNADYIGVIIGILAVLVTVLVGWQVFTLIEIKSVLRRVRATENRLSKTEQRIIKKIHKENADVSMVHVFSLIRDLGDNLNESQMPEVRLIYGLSAETLKKQLIVGKMTHIQNCLQVMEIGILFADRLNVWNRLFDETTMAVLNKTYDEIIPLTTSLTQEQKSRLLHIHESRISQRLHEALRPANAAQPQNTTV